MRILAIDTATGTAAAAITENKRLLAETSVNFNRKHSQQILPMIDSLLKYTDMTAAEVDLFAVASGPGSFTGLRIGVATVKSLAHAVSKPAVGVSTLESLAYAVPWADAAVVPVMDARRNNVFCGFYMLRGGKPEQLAPDTAAHIDEVINKCAAFERVIFTGDGAKLHRERILESLKDRAFIMPEYAAHNRAAAVGAAAFDKLQSGCECDYIKLNPIYLRKPQAEQERERLNKC